MLSFQYDLNGGSTIKWNSNHFAFRPFSIIIMNVHFTNMIYNIQFILYEFSHNLDNKFIFIRLERNNDLLSSLE